MVRQDDTLVDVEISTDLSDTGGTLEVVNTLEGVKTDLGNGMWKIASPNVEKPRSLSAVEKIALEKKDKLLTEKAESKQDLCWKECGRRATVWVREVGFDFKGDKADPVQHIAVSSANYTGPVPGFCHFCMAYGPASLAETVYFSRPEMYWGVRPTRWFVVFTDGSRQGDSILSIDPKQTMPKIVEDFTTRETT